MAFWDASADAVLGPYLAPTVLDNLASNAVEVDVVWGLEAPTDLDKWGRVDALVSWELETAADLSIGAPLGTKVVSAPVTLGRWRSTSSLSRFTDLTGADVPAYVEFRDNGLLGAWKGCPGPAGTVILAGEGSREIIILKYDDIYSLDVIGRRIKVDGRPRAIASNILAPDLRADTNNKHFWVLVEGHEAANGNPKLQCYECTLDAPLVSELELTRDVNPELLWASNDLPGAGFIVVGGSDGAVQIRSDDPEMELLAEIGTGIYQPSVVDVQKADPPANADFVRIWHIVVFSETSARGVVLEYREQALTVTVVVPTQTIEADVSYGPYTAPAVIRKFDQIGVEAETSWAIAMPTQLFVTDPVAQANIDADIVFRPFTADNTSVNIEVNP